MARSGREGLERAAADLPDVVLLDVGLPDWSGLEVYDRLRRIDPRVPVIFITAMATTDTAIEAMRRGAFDYLFKPVDLGQLEKVVGDALKLSRRMRQPTSLGTPPANGEGGDAIVGRSPAMQEVYKAIGRVADKNVTVLITGESGTGKELVARAVYQHSRRAHAPFLAVNCAAIPESLLESEMFGHEKGAFTGADRRRIGMFERCNGGTIFLDEIGDMPPATQGKILRLLQDQRFERVGGSEPVQTDVRVIAATNRDLRAWAGAGRFRPDLYYRLSVFNIQVPPLRERADDLPLLVQFFIYRFRQELEHQVEHVAPEAMRRLGAHAWPGNVRELQGVLKQALLRAQGQLLMPEFLPKFLAAPLAGAAPEVRSQAAADAPALASAGGPLDVFTQQRLRAGSTDLYSEAHLEFDRVLLPEVLHFTRGNQLQAAKILGVARQTLRNRLRDLNLSVARSVEAEQEPAQRPGPDAV